MKQYELDSRFSREQVWGRLSRASQGTIRGRTETRYFEIKIKPRQNYRFDSTLDIWILPEPDEFGQLPSGKRMKHEARLCFRGSIKPTETGSKLVGRFHMGSRTMAFYIWVTLLAVARHAAKDPSYRTVMGVVSLLALSALVWALVLAIKSRAGKENRISREQWFLRFLAKQLLHP